jgi:hypothetical protein
VKPLSTASPITPSPEAAVTPEPAGVWVTSAPRTTLTLQLGAAMGAGALSVPMGLALASWTGTLSNSLIWSALPALLSMGLVAPTLTTLAAWLIGNHSSPGRFGFWLPWAATVAVNAVSLVVAGFAGMSFGLPLQVLVFSIVEGALLGGTSVATMRLLERRAEAVTTVPSFSPGISQTQLVPVATARF